MLRTMMMLCAILIGLTSFSAPSYAEVDPTTESPYDASTIPENPMTPEEGEDRPYMYDLRTTTQVLYWGHVVDGLISKVATYISDESEAPDTDKIWDIIEDNEISVNQPEKMVLCLYLEDEDDAPEEEVIPDFPDWPECGGILDGMFGDGIADYLAANDGDDDLLLVYQSLIENMGMSPSGMESTINEQAGGGFDGWPQDDGLTGTDCHEPATSIRSYEVTGCGVLCTVTRIIMGLLDSASRALFTATVGNADFQNTVIALMMLYVTIYGAMVVLGFVNVAMGDLLVRVVKLGVVAMLLTSDALNYLFEIVRCFFIEGTTYLINEVLTIGMEAVISFSSGAAVVDVRGTFYDTSAAGIGICGESFDDSYQGGPLVVLESLLTQIFSMQMFIVLITLATTKVYGFILAIFLFWGLWAFIMSLLYAVTLYLTALIGQYLLLSLMPIFLCFILFEKTKYLFDGWLNQLVGYSLTPIFLFAYISLFVVVVEAAIAQILDVKICWHKWITVAWVFDISKYQFDDGGAPMVELPFGFFEILIFLLLVYLMKEFESSVEHIARDISNTYVYMNKAAKDLRQYFKDKKQGVKDGAKSTAAAGARAAARKIAEKRKGVEVGQTGQDSTSAGTTSGNNPPPKSR